MEENMDSTNEFVCLESEGFFLHEYTPIELLGNAKNSIVEAIVLSARLPEEIEHKLHEAFLLISIAQEYLYSN